MHSPTAFAHANAVENSTPCDSHSTSDQRPGGIPARADASAIVISAASLAFRKASAKPGTTDVERGVAAERGRPAERLTGLSDMITSLVRPHYNLLPYPVSVNRHSTHSPKFQTIKWSVTDCRDASIIVATEFPTAYRGLTMLFAAMSTWTLCGLTATTVLAVAAWIYDVIDKRINPVNRESEVELYSSSVSPRNPIPLVLPRLDVEEILTAG